MSILTAMPNIGNIFGKAMDVVNKFIPDKDLAAKLQHELEITFTQINHTEFIEGLKAPNPTGFRRDTGLTVVKSQLRRSEGKIAKVRWGGSEKKNAAKHNIAPG